MIDETHEYKFTVHECLEKGIHWWKEPITKVSFGIPPRRKQYTQTCMYCGFIQRGYQPPIVWEDTD